MFNWNVIENSYYAFLSNAIYSKEILARFNRNETKIKATNKICSFYFLLTFINKINFFTNIFLI